jgi:calcium binding protein 39
MNFFKTKPRAPPDIVRSLRDAIPRLENGAPGGETRRKVRIILVGACLD